MTDVVLLDRFFTRVHLHLVATYGDTGRWPVIMGVFGRAGDGKSIQLSAALERCSVEPLRLNAADLESGLAGEPGKHIARTYATASLALAKGVPTALVLDDVDTTVGEWEQNTGTVNHQQVLAELMHLADRPVDPARNFPRRVPVFVTGNNLSRLYPPLRRHGRMDAFAWRPRPQEVREVLYGMFMDVCDAASLDRLAEEFPGEPLSFFAGVRQALTTAELTELLKLVGHDMRAFLRANGASFGGDLGRRRITGTGLIAVAERVRAERDAAQEDFLADNHHGGRPR
ncbi:AAA family ATPase [Sphaerisporangium sp. TRM90804]|uniref:AAA family ATPase n=1 Tax=Sphaerisporangium sp. TRM90804 TaxID=3031113 RepID=UPI00244BFDAF|nr:AAA family ATPase [Sphaerisporangium sp. TRM90804]MDH2430413.1 AAA family ATPase [Sphaerisporangium sp. TRM90804]